ncbi:restriction endonuclease [Marinilactibacillus kalidii]|uniref:restriction endonuclease n=1 Tax=Marinilactibacillus kalidii TaxID=2820274 RepID=UPI001ABED132|nr:restriction endonuclease [Marinilactibacillus kalidii]
MENIPFEIQQQIIKCFGQCFYYKSTVASFMRTCGVPEPLIIRWKDKPKYIWAKSVLDELNQNEKGKLIIRKIASEFFRMRDVPDEATSRNDGISALKKLKKLIIQNDIIDKNPETNNSYYQSQKELKIKKLQSKSIALNELKEKYFSQFSNQNVQQRGFELEEIISKLFKINDIPYHNSFRNTKNTQQMDGHFRFEGFDYLVEAKWEGGFVDSAKIASLKQKVDTKLNSTRGLFLAINGFREEVINDYSNKEAKILFMNGQELVYILENRISLQEVLTLKITEASKTGNPYTSVMNHIL